MAIDRERVLAAAQKYVEKKKYDRAVAEYQKVIQEDPNDARTLLKVGDLQSKMEAYAKLAGPAIQANGGTFLVRGNPSKVHEGGLMQRVVVIEFESVEQATRAHDSEAYQEALRALGDGADRDIRIVEGTS